MNEFDVRAWLEKPNGKTKGRKERKVVREIVHPIFADCAKVATNQFWVDLLLDCASGKFPTSHFKYDNPTFRYRKGARSAEVDLPYNVYEAVHVIINMFKTYGNIFSPTEAAEQQSRNMAEPVVIVWDKRHGNINDNVIARYMDVVRRGLNLDLAAFNSLRRVIYRGIEDGYYNAQTITIEYRHIVNIEGLYFDSVENVFHPADYMQASVVKQITHSTAPPVVPAGNHERNWAKCERHLAHLNQKYCGNGPTRTRYTTSVAAGAEYDMSVNGEMTSPQSSVW